MCLHYGTVDGKIDSSWQSGTIVLGGVLEERARRGRRGLGRGR